MVYCTYFIWNICCFKLISFVLFGQFITIISRPIGRIKNNEPKSIIEVDSNLEEKKI
jgi:hypothetical protein